MIDDCTLCIAYTCISYMYLHVYYSTHDLLFGPGKKNKMNMNMDKQ